MRVYPNAPLGSQYVNLSKINLFSINLNYLILKIISCRWSNPRRITYVITHILVDIHYKIHRMGDHEV